MKEIDLKNTKKKKEMTFLKLFTDLSEFRRTDFESVSTESICENLQTRGLVNITTELEYRIFNILSSCSIIACVIIFLTSFWNEKLMQHPYRLIATIALCDATYLLLFNSIDEICELKLY